MSRGARIIVSASIGAALACSGGQPAPGRDSAQPSPEMPAPTADPTLLTDRAEYRPVVDTLYTVAAIGFRFTNPGPDTAFISGCRGPTSPMLEKWVAGTWRGVYSSVELMCLGPPLVVPPGGVHADTFHLRGARPGRNIAPVFEADQVAGYYRLAWAIHGLRDPADPLRVDALWPVARRVSNVFRFVE